MSTMRALHGTHVEIAPARLSSSGVRIFGPQHGRRGGVFDLHPVGGPPRPYGRSTSFDTRPSSPAPTLTWAGGGTCVSEIVQYTWVDPTTPLVAGTKNGAQTGTAHTCATVNSSVDQSIVGFYQNAFGSLRLSSVQIATFGSTSGAVSSTGTSVPWGTFPLRDEVSRGSQAIVKQTADGDGLRCAIDRNQIPIRTHRSRRRFALVAS